MAATEKSYTLSPAFLKNVLNDIAEMRKAKVTGESEDRLEIDTDMYGIKTAYRFRMTRGPSVTLLAVETDGESENARGGVQMMIAMIDGMIGSLASDGVRP